MAGLAVERFGANANANEKETVNFGLMTDLGFAYWGSRAPGGVISGIALIDLGQISSRFALGPDINADFSLAAALEWPRTGSVATYPIHPVTGLDWKHSFTYQAKTGKSRVDAAGNHFGTYSVADRADAFSIFLGLKAEIPAAKRFFAELGYTYQFSFNGKNLKEVEIQNCYVDSCPNSDESGGGKHPAPKQAYYLAFSVVF